VVSVVVVRRVFTRFEQNVGVAVCMGSAILPGKGISTPGCLYGTANALKNICCQLSILHDVVVWS
jgi:hypothetical protein